MALLYWPGGEFMYLVFTTSTGEAITVVTKPAPNADTKWHGRLSEDSRERSGWMAIIIRSQLCSIEKHDCVILWLGQYKWQICTNLLLLYSLHREEKIHCVLYCRSLLCSYQLQRWEGVWICAQSAVCQGLRRVCAVRLRSSDKHTSWPYLTSACVWGWPPLSGRM